MALFFAFILLEQKQNPIFAPSLKPLMVIGSIRNSCDAGDTVKFNPHVSS